MKLWLSALIRILLTPLVTLVAFLPRRVELVFGRFLGKFLYFVSRRRRVAFDNIRRCLPEKKVEEWNALLKKNYEHYGVLVLELMHLFSPIPGHYRRYAKKNTEVTGLENFKKAAAKGNGVLFVSSHLGNWELMVAGGALAGIPLTMVTKHLKPEWLHKKIESSRASADVKAVYEPRTLPTVMRALRKSEAVGFVMDQYAGPPIGIPVRFFGVKVGTLAAVSTLAQRTGAVVLPVCTYRNGNGKVHISIEPPMNLDDVLDNEEKTTEVIAQRVESWVRQYPEQWLWIHRRFKNVVWPEELA